jgi:hypothetical protein
MNQPVLLDLARAAESGIVLSLSEDMDRVPEDGRGPNACPMCDDGILTITHPVRCKACIAEGL